MKQENLDNYHKAITDDISKAQSKIFEGLVTNHKPNALPEHIFKSYFLPGFLGTNPNANWLLEWVSIAGSPSAEVSIVDNAGVELFRVPCILSTKNVQLSGNGPGLADIFRHSSLLSNSLAGNKSFLLNNLSDKASEALSDVGNSDVARWRAIYERYGVIQKETDKPVAEAESDMFDF